eukprot:jgi/Orpsp1_1/1174077/evm.model.c7180000048835.1
MNIFILTLNFLYIFNNVLVQGYYQKNMENKNVSINKRDSAGGECAYINSLLGKDSSYDCCNNPNILCSDNHIFH